VETLESDLSNCRSCALSLKIVLDNLLYHLRDLSSLHLHTTPCCTFHLPRGARSNIHHWRSPLNIVVTVTREYEMVRRQCPPLFNSPSDAFSILYLLSSNAAMPTAVVTMQISSFPNKEIETTGVKKHRHTTHPGHPTSPNTR